MSISTPPRPKADGPRRVRRLNLRALAILGAALLLGVGALAAVVLVRGSGGQDALIGQARRSLEAGRGDLALSYLSEALRRDPRNLEALELKADLLAKAPSGEGDVKEALRLGNLALQQAPDEPLARKIGLRQIGLNLRVGQLRTADAVAAGLREKSPDDPEILRMSGMAKEALDANTDDANALDEALNFYEKALALDPSDSTTAARLAVLYLEKKGDPERGLAVLDAVLAATPEAATAHLVMHRYQAEIGRRAAAAGDGPAAEAAYDRADAELDRALELAGDDLDARLAAAEYALRRGRPEVAREHIEALPEDARKRPSVKALLGLAELQRNKPELAIEAWRSGLLEAHGTDADLTWRLAVLLLKTGRVAEAEPLVDQFGRLSGGDEPTPAHSYLEALTLLRSNRPAEAIGLLEKARPRAPATLKAEMLLTLGQAYEAVRDEAEALELYDAASAADPRMAAPRLARYRLLRGRRPALAEEELRRAEQDLGNDPNVLIARARAAFAEQAARPDDRRDWSEVESLVARAAEVAPAASELALLQAELLTARGQHDESLELLERATAVQKADAELWLARARRLARAGRVDAALAVLDQAADPSAAGDQASLRIEKARLLTLRGRGQDARSLLVADLDRLPPSQHPAVWAALGDLHAAQRAPEDAFIAYKNWADLTPNDPLPRLFLVEQALARGAQKEADEQIGKLENAGGQDSPFYRIARVQKLIRPVAGESEADREARLDQAEELAAELEVESPDRFGPIVRAQVLERRGKKAEAAAAYEQALGRDGGRVALGPLVRLYTELGRAEQIEKLRRDHGIELPNLDRALAEEALRQGDAARAEELARDIVRADPASFDTRMWQVRLLNTLGKPEQAEATLRQFIGLQPGRAEPRLALIDFLAGRGLGAKAAEAAEELVASTEGPGRPALVHAQAWRLAGRIDKADAAFAEALERAPEDVEVIRAAADYYEAGGRPALAEEVLRDYLGRKPQERWAVRALALLRSARPGDLKAWGEAWALILDAEEGTEVGPEERLARGIVLARSADEAQRQQAVELLAGLVLDLPAEYPSAAVARNVLAGLYARAGRFGEMAEVVAIDARPRDAARAAVVRYAEALILAGRLDEAAAQVDRIEAADPADPGVARLRARLLVAGGKKAEAAARLAAAFDALGGGPEARVEARRLLAAQLDLDPVAAEALAVRMAEAWPEARWMRGAALARQGKAAEALAAYRDAASAAEPADLVEIGRDALNLATAAPDGGSGPADASLMAAAEEVLDALDARDPENPEISVLKGYLRHFQARYDEEIALYQRALRLNPEDPSFLNNMAWSLSEGLKRPEDALPYIEQAFARADRVYPQFYDTRGVIFSRLGRLDRAVADLELAAQARPTPAVLAHLARAYHQAGRLDDFRKARDRAKELGLTRDRLEPIDRDELEPLLFGDDPAPAGR